MSQVLSFPFHSSLLTHSQAVAPKRARLLEAQQRLEATLKALEGAKGKLHAVEENVRDLEAKYAESVAKKRDLTTKVMSNRYFLIIVFIFLFFICIGPRVRTKIRESAKIDRRAQ